MILFLYVTKWYIIMGILLGHCLIFKNILHLSTNIYVYIYITDLVQ